MSVVDGLQRVGFSRRDQEQQIAVRQMFETLALNPAVLGAAKVRAGNIEAHGAKPWAMPRAERLALA